MNATVTVKNNYQYPVFSPIFYNLGARWSLDEDIFSLLMQAVLVEFDDGKLGVQREGLGHVHPW